MSESKVSVAERKRLPLKVCWNILMNSNSLDIDEIWVDGLEQTWEYITSHPYRFIKWVDTPGKVLGVRETHGIEVGPETGYVHLHGRWELTVTQKIHLNYAGMNEFLHMQGEATGERGIVKAQPVRNYNAEAYIDAYNSKNADVAPQRKRGGFKLVT